MTILASSLLGLIIGVCVTRISMIVARVLKVLDLPGPIKVHTAPTPRLGGLGVVVGTLLGSLSMMHLVRFSGASAMATLVGGSIIAVTGLTDDVRSLRPALKFLGQLVAAASFMVLYRGSLAIVLLSSWFSRGLSSLAMMIFICAVSNGMNFLDGMDGLAGGCTLIMAVFLAILAALGGRWGLCIILGTLGGSCMGFLVYNVPPARTFMGDVGSLFMGYMIACASLQVVFSPGVPISRPLGVLLITLVPVADVSLAVLRRLGSSRAVVTGDRRHLYDCIHRRLGGNIWRTLFAVWGSVVASSLAGLLAYFSEPHYAITVALAAVVTLLIGAVSVGCFGVVQEPTPSKPSAQTPVPTSLRSERPSGDRNP